MIEHTGILISGLQRTTRNKRYIFWFWLLNLTLAEFGSSAFRKSAHAILDHSSYAGGLVHGFDLSVMGELFARPEFGTFAAASTPAMYFAFIFFMFSALFMPGVFLGYSSNYRLPRHDFFRACGRNLWRFIRLMIIAGIVMGIVSGILFAINGAINKKAVEGTNEVLPFELRMIGMGIIFLVMTVLRIWFDLAEADVVLNNQNAVRKSIGWAFGQTFSGFFRLLGSYVLAALVAIAGLAFGLAFWMHFVPPASIFGAFVVAQVILFFLLIPRFWQRGIAVSYWQQKRLEPVTISMSTTTVETVPVAPAVAQS